MEYLLALSLSESGVVASDDYALAGHLAGHPGTVQHSQTLNAGDAIPLPLQEVGFELDLALEPGLISIAVTAADTAIGAGITESFQIHCARFDRINLSDRTLMRALLLIAGIHRSCGSVLAAVVAGGGLLRLVRARPSESA